MRFEQSSKRIALSRALYHLKPTTALENLSARLGLKKTEEVKALGFLNIIPCDFLLLVRKAQLMGFNKVSGDRFE